MNISDNTISVLKNYASINPSIYIRQGSKLRTKSPDGTVLSIAKIEENFDNDFAIYNLSKFLSTIAMFQKPDINVSDTHLDIIEENRSVQYTLVNPELISYPENKDPKVPGKIACEFDIKMFEMNQLMKAVSVLSMPSISIIGDGENITLNTSDPENPSSDSYSVVIGKTNNKFSALIKADKIKVMPNNYDVKVYDIGFVSFLNEKIDYHIACEINGTSFDEIND